MKLKNPALFFYHLKKKIFLKLIKNVFIKNAELSLFWEIKAETIKFIQTHLKKTILLLIFNFCILLIKKCSAS